MVKVVSLDKAKNEKALKDLMNAYAQVGLYAQRTSKKK